MHVLSIVRATIHTDSRPNPPVMARRATADPRRGPAGDLRRTLRDKAWVAFLLAGALAILGYRLIPIGRGQDLVYLALGLAGVGAIFVGVRLHRPIRAWPWYLMAAGQLLWVIGDGVDSWLSDVEHVDSFPSLADVFYLAAYPVIAAGLVLLIRGRRPRRDLAGLLDSATVTTGLGLLSWVVLARPILDSERQSFATAAVAVAYPLADILLVGLLIRLLTTPGGRTPALRLLMVAVCLLVAGDTTSSALSLFTSSSTSSYDFVWLASYIVWGASALHPSMYLLSEPTADLSVRFSRARLAVLALATLIAPGTLAVQETAGLGLAVWPVVIGAVVMFLLVVARMNVVIAQIVAANRHSRELRDEIEHQADHDSLTDLPNRAHAMRLLGAALGRARLNGSVVGVLFVDLDGFKNVNDTLGHRAGDAVLQIAAGRIQSAVRTADTVARLGGDEFVVVLEPIDSEESAVAVADRVVGVLSRPMMLDQRHEVRIGGSVGVALSGIGSNEVEALLHEADLAAYRAKAGGRGRTEVFNDRLRSELALRATLEGDIRRAVASDELVVHYQPIIHVRTGRVQGFEALVRWDRPGLGLVPPSDFIPIAEASDLICEVDTWVLHHATRQLAAWNDCAGARDLYMAVNISGRHIVKARIEDDVAATLRGAAISPAQLVLEVTETVLVDESAAVRRIKNLREGGVRISIDDFGTGYNSISRLENVPVDIVKIDQRFLDRSVMSSVRLLPFLVQAAHAFGLPVIAEGVETAEQLAVLASIGCESSQGFHLARPMTATEAQAYLGSHSRTDGSVLSVDAVTQLG